MAALSYRPLADLTLNPVSDTTPACLGRPDPLPCVAGGRSGSVFPFRPSTMVTVLNHRKRKVLPAAELSGGWRTRSALSSPCQPFHWGLFSCCTGNPKRRRGRSDSIVEKFLARGFQSRGASVGENVTECYDFCGSNPSGWLTSCVTATDATWSKAPTRFERRQSC